MRSFRDLWFAPFLFSAIAHAQQFGFTQYTPNDGLAQSQVRAIAQDAEGYLWFGTLGGASRFDGHTFTNYALQEGLPDAQVNAVFCAKDGTVWLGAGGSLVAFEGKRSRTITLPSAAREARILSLAELPNGDLLVGTDGSGLLRCSGDSIVPLPGFPSDTASTVRALLVLSSGEVVVGTRAGAYRWNNNSCSVIELGPGVESISALARDKEGTLWFGTFRDGLYGSKSDGSLLAFDEKNGLLQDNVRALLVDAKGKLWIGTKFGTNVLEKDRLRSFTVHQGMPNDNVWCLFEDRDGSVWMGTDGAGALRYAGDRFVTWTVANGLCSDLVMTMAADARGDLWLGTYGNGICRMDGMALLSTSEGLRNNTIWCALTAPDSSLWFGTTNGLVHLRNGVVIPLDSTRSLSETRVLALHRDTDGTLWCGTREGLAIIPPQGPVQLLNKDDRTLLRSVRAIVENEDAHLLATDLGVVRMRNGVTEQWSTAQGLCDNTIQCLLVDAAKRTWIGTTNGLACHDGKRLINLRLGTDFGSNYIDLLLDDGAGLIWAGTNNGLFRFDPDSLLLDAANKEHFTAVDGIRGTECNLNAGFRDAQGRLFFGTNAGLVMHDPARGSASGPSQGLAVRLTNLRSFMLTTDWRGQCDSVDTRTGLPAGLDLVYRKNHLTFDYTAIALADADRVRFQYRLLGFDPDWLPPTDARFASYSNLPQGEYAFQVRASRNGHGWGPETSFPFHIAPPYWLRWWFFLGCAFVIGSLAFGVMRFRSIRRARQEKTRQLMLRSRMLQLEQQALNANMNRHFIFNALNSIQYYINRQDRMAANRYLTSFAKLIRKNLDASRNDTTTLAEELERLDLYLVLEHMRFKDKFMYEVMIDPTVDTHRIELPAMMLQPYVENSIWHGILPTERPGTVSIRVSAGIPGHVRITIMDDGIGVETSRELKNGNGSDHISRGIEITKGRADVLRRLGLSDIRITGPEQLHDASGQPSGTSVTIELPSKESVSTGQIDLQKVEEEPTFDRP
ncbi:MAG: histidine kinase [Flavobacteriales bacterium]|nr:histidine kinase [Flavobacteriales bacterium]